MNEFIHLSNHSASLVISRANKQIPAVSYFGTALNEQVQIESLLESQLQAVPQAGLDSLQRLSLFPTNADALFSHSAYAGHVDGFDWSPIFEFDHWHQNKNHLIIGLVSAQGISIEIELDLHSTGVLSLQTQVINTAEINLSINELYSAFPLPAHASQCMSFTGRWCQEFQPQNHQVPFGSMVFENLKGRTSQDHFPGVILGTPGFTEQSGTLLGAHLGWSGNHSIRIEKSQTGLDYLLAGMNLMPGEVQLSCGESFSTPWLYLSHSDNGLTKMSQQFHDYVREQIIEWPQIKPRPVHLNTWEAVYFRHDLEELKALANRAASTGVERFILDDGWFRGRNNDKAALGDWFVDNKKYPQGLHPLINHVKNLGMEFGLWFEPEMINPDSDLYRQHPEWVLPADHENQPLARSQFVLNLCNQECFDWIAGRLKALLEEYKIDYIKWDMNRDLVQASHLGKASYYRQTQAVYRLFDFVRQHHPDIEIESCASGGGRIDFEILKRSHRFWTSDCNDALERQFIQKHFSLFFPPEVMGAHMGPDKSHTTGRRHDARFRSLTSLWGHMGIEANLNTCTDNEVQEFTAAISLYKKYRQLIHSGNSVRIDTDDRCLALGVVSRNQQEALFQYIQLKMPSASVPAQLKFTGLDPQRVYQVTTLLAPEHTEHLMKILPPWMLSGNIQLSGQQLILCGLAMPVMDPESAFLFEINALHLSDGS